MKSLLIVIKAMLEILASQQAQISELQRNAELDNESDLTETDFAALTAQIETLNASAIADDVAVPF